MTGLLAIAGMAAIAALPVPAAAQPAAVPPLPDAATRGLPTLRALGGGLLRILGFQIYNAWLWAPETGFDPRKPFVLDIHYLRNFTARQLAERSIDEMRGQGTGNDSHHVLWLADMQRVFSDVAPGDRLTGVATASRSARFFHNGSLRGEIADPAFTDAFFAIWLGDKSSQPKMRDRLLGKSDG